MDNILDFPQRCQPGFEEYLEKFQPETLERHSGTVFGLWPDLKLAYFNPHWVSFVRANHGPNCLATTECLGLDLMQVIPDVLRPFYRSMYDAAQQDRSAATQPLQFEYECSSPTIFRKFLMSLYAVDRALIIVNSTVTEQPFPLPGRAIHPAHLKNYQSATRMISMCSHCRRVLHQHEANRWDWVPQWVAQMPPGISHTLCPFCFDYFYPKRSKAPLA